MIGIIVDSVMEVLGFEEVESLDVLFVGYKVVFWSVFFFIMIIIVLFVVGFWGVGIVNEVYFKLDYELWLISF